MISIEQETTDDTWAVETLYDQCFSPGREALPSYRLRAHGHRIDALCLVARDGFGSVAGAVRHWPVRIGDGDAPALLLGPIAVHPTHQGAFIGQNLVRQSEIIARDLGWERRLLVGDLPYYGRFGFVRLAHVDFPPPTDPNRILGQSLIGDSWIDITGTVRPWV